MNVFGVRCAFGGERVPAGHVGNCVWAYVNFVNLFQRRSQRYRHRWRRYLSNLSEVFGQRNPATRATAIAEIYTTDFAFHETDEDVVATKRCQKRVEAILADAPDFVFPISTMAPRSEMMNDLVAPIFGVSALGMVWLR